MAWDKWTCTAKLAIITNEDLQIEKLLRPRPTNADIDYPQEPLYELPIVDETKIKLRQGSKKTSREKKDWKNFCQAVETKASMLITNHGKSQILRQRVSCINHLNKKPHTYSTKGTHIAKWQNAQQTHSLNSERIHLKRYATRHLIDINSSIASKTSMHHWEISTRGWSKKQHFSARRT